MNYTIEQLQSLANHIREDIIKMLMAAKSGHSAGPLGMADVFTALYFGGVLNHDSRNPDWPERDKVFLSNGHICPILYAVLAHAGYFPLKELITLRKLGTRLQGHPHYGDLPGIENTSGPLAQGASVAVGCAYAAKMDKKKNQIFCFVGDGEQQEGQTWEAALFAGKHKLDNLTFIMDRNNIQIDGFTEDVMPLEPLADKYRAFGWHVLEVDGHNIQRIIGALNEAKAIYEKPVMLLCHTIPGKGVSFMEFDYKWHGSPPNAEQGKQALEELAKLRTLGGQIVGEHE